MRRLFALILGLLLLISAAGCSTRGEEEPPEETTDAAPETTTPEPTATPEATPAASSPEPTEDPEETPEPTPEPTEDPEPAYRNPLNGAGLDAPYDKRPFTVMLNNLNLALPHCGVEQVDVLYEVLAEGGITRMIGVFSDIESVGKVGPVRSIRPYFLEIGQSYGAVIGHAGGSEEAYSLIYRGNLETLDGVRETYSFQAFYRDPNRLWKGAEHALFTTGENLSKIAEERNYSLTVGEDYDSGLRFVADGTPENGEDAAKLTVHYGVQTAKYTTFTYDKDKGLYSVYQQGQDYIDENTGNKVLFRNVLVIHATTSVIDDYGRLNVRLVGSGEGYFLCGGKYVPITWEHSATGECFRYYLQDGSELELGVGKTFISILPGEGVTEFD